MFKKKKINEKKIRNLEYKVDENTKKRLLLQKSFK